MLVGATIATGACTTSLTDSAGPDSAGLSTPPNSSPAAVVLDEMGSFLIAAGCTRTTASDTGLIVLGFTSAAGQRFDCAGVDPAARRAAYRSEVLANAARRARETGMAMALSGYYEWNVIDVQSVCTSYLGSHSLSFPTSGWQEGSAPDGTSVGWYYFEAGVPIRFDFYQDTPCTETIVSRGDFVPFDDGDGSGGDGGCCGGSPGGDVPPSSPPPEPGDSVAVRDDEWVCKAKDPLCHLALTALDTALIMQARSFFRPPEAISDPTARMECSQAIQWFETAWADGKVFRGASDTGNPPLAGSTVGESDPADSTFHIDPFFLDNATTTPRIRRIARTLLHEAVHTHGRLGHVDYTAPPLSNPTANSENYGGYRYYRYIHSFDEATSCIDFLD